MLTKCAFNFGDAAKLFNVGVDKAGRFGKEFGEKAQQFGDYIKPAAQQFGEYAGEKATKASESLIGKGSTNFIKKYAPAVGKGLWNTVGKGSVGAAKLGLRGIEGVAGWMLKNPIQNAFKLGATAATLGAAKKMFIDTDYPVEKKNYRYF